MAANEDMFDDLLNLEETYYQEGYDLGLRDGAHAGRIEGRTFGLEKGFEKFFAMGRLAGKAHVLESRFSPSTSTTVPSTSASTAAPAPTLPANERLAKHVRTLYALTEHESLSTANDEDSVSEFDDRFKRAVAKDKVIETILQHQQRGGSAGAIAGASGSADAARVEGGSRARTAGATERSIEDFGIAGVGSHIRRRQEARE